MEFNFSRKQAIALESLGNGPCSQVLLFVARLYTNAWLWVEVDKGVKYRYGRNNLAHYYYMAIFLHRSCSSTLKHITRKNRTKTKKTPQTIMAKAMILSHSSLLKKNILYKQEMTSLSQNIKIYITCKHWSVKSMNLQKRELPTRPCLSIPWQHTYFWCRKTCHLLREILQ